MTLRVLFTVGVFSGLLAAAAVRAQTPAQFEGRLVWEGTGAPVSRATVTIVGMAGAIRSDIDGRFAWAPAPRPPFHVVVVLESGQVARPIVVDAVPATVASLYVKEMTSEALTVLGSAPSISAAPAAAKSVLGSSQMSPRNPENLVQALETIPGVSQVSEGHAAVPALRGLARGRTLLLVDGARVAAERRVGPSATFVDPSTLAAIDVARGPGSVAYGSDALGGVISVRTRRTQPGTPLTFRATGTIGGGLPEGRGSLELLKGLERGGIFVQVHS